MTLTLDKEKQLHQVKAALQGKSSLLSICLLTLANFTFGCGRDEQTVYIVQKGEDNSGWEQLARQKLAQTVTYGNTMAEERRVDHFSYLGINRESHFDAQALELLGSVSERGTAFAATGAGGLPYTTTTLSTPRLLDTSSGLNEAVRDANIAGQMATATMSNNVVHENAGVLKEGIRTAGKLAAGLLAGPAGGAAATTSDSIPETGSNDEVIPTPKNIVKASSATPQKSQAVSIAKPLENKKIPKVVNVQKPICVANDVETALRRSVPEDLDIDYLTITDKQSHVDAPRRVVVAAGNAALGTAATGNVEASPMAALAGAAGEVVSIATAPKPPLEDLKQTYDPEALRLLLDYRRHQDAPNRWIKEEPFWRFREGLPPKENPVWIRENKEKLEKLRKRNAEVDGLQRKANQQAIKKL